MDSTSDTIAAISTPIGQGGIGIIRISGPSAEQILKKIFRKSKPSDENFKSQIQYHGWIVDNSEDIHIDEVVATLKRRPRSFTGEDVVEINSHGGLAVMQAILSLIIRHGARLAERGEFTKRAFLNGKIDLSRAEGIIEIIKAKTIRGVLASAALLRGTLGHKISLLRGQIMDLQARIEASIDFEDDVGPLNKEEINKLLKGVITEIAQLFQTSDAGKILREGLKVAIIGRPNVGKSSLLNAILRESRAIVTDSPGTTRDLIVENLNVFGLPMVLIDTAGIREWGQKEEKIGVELAVNCIETADMILLVLDTSEPLTNEDINLLNLTAKKPRIIVLNKSDLTPAFDGLAVDNLGPKAQLIKISALKGEGVESLEKLILQVVGIAEIEADNSEVLLRIRHKECLEKARLYLENALKSLSLGLQPELISVDLKQAIISLGELSGEEVSDEVLNKIFDEFCVGK